MAIGKKYPVASTQLPVFFAGYWVLGTENGFPDAD